MRKSWIVKAGLLLAAALLILLLVWNWTHPDAEPAGQQTGGSAGSDRGSQEPAQTDMDIDAGKVRISELMLRNKATLPDEDGDFPDWIELENLSDDPVDLNGWRLNDREGKGGWTFPEMQLPVGGRIVIFASGKDLPGHCSFSLSAGETLALYTRQGTLADKLLCPDGETDRSWIPDGTGGCTESLYPTPGQPNTNQGYDALMEAQVNDSPLQINEVCTFNSAYEHRDLLGSSDWVELKNVSGEPLELSDYYLSDDSDERLLFRLPEGKLEPGDCFVLRCDNGKETRGSAPLCPEFSLGSTAEHLYLSRADGSLADYVSLRDIPFEGSFGRLPGENGWFFFRETSPGEENAGGMRRISAMPGALTPEGVFNDVEDVPVALEGRGEIHYTLDSSYPTADSPLYTGPFTVDRTCVVRAVSVEEGAFPSRALTLCFIINENHTLPVVSLVSDDERFQWMYQNGAKGMETPCSLSYFDEKGGFTIPCGVKMNGETSLRLQKKNMSIRFRAVYGQEQLEYDMFGGGVTEFDNLLLRAGQDYYAALIRNELCTELALAATDKVVVSRCRYSVLYIDGEYWGIYAMGEKLNESMYAHWAGVSRESVTVETPLLDPRHEMYWEVIEYAQTHDLSVPEYYEEICTRLDVESLADWLVLEGIFANDDLSYANVRYCRSTENDGKWRVMLYDLDAAFYKTDYCFGNLLSYWSQDHRQVAGLLGRLLKNGDFRALVLRRAGEILSGPLSNRRILEEIDLLESIVKPEVPRDFSKHNMRVGDWTWNVEFIRDLIRDKNWEQLCVDRLCGYLNVTPQERELYFSGVTGDGN